MRDLRRLPFFLMLGIMLTAAGAQSVDPLDLVKQGKKLVSEGKYDAALELYQQALQRSPDLFDAHLAAGIALDLKGNYKEAQQHFEKAIQLAPDGSKNQTLANMGISHAFERNAKSASTFYRQVFDRQMSAPDLAGAAETANALGRVYLECGDLDNALKWYQTGYE